MGLDFKWTLETTRQIKFNRCGVSIVSAAAISGRFNHLFFGFRNLAAHHSSSDLTEVADNSNAAFKPGNPH